jgi:hypothetical protein
MKQFANPITEEMVQLIAEESGSDPRTVLRRLLGWPSKRPNVVARIDRAIANFYQPTV